MSQENKRDKDEMRPEYDIRGGVRGKYYERYQKGTNVVVLEMGEGRIAATVKDCQPNDPTPGLDLYFPNAVAERFHWEHKQPVEILLDEGAPWRGTVGVKPPNPPYLHRPLTRDGEKMSMRDWLLDQRIADGARVELIQESHTRFRWSRVLDPGRWAPGRAPEDRPAARLRKPSTTKPSSSNSTPLSSYETFPLFDRSAVLRLSEDYWNLIAYAEREAELTFEKEMPEYRRLGYLDKRMFLALACWKSRRPLPLYESNSDDGIRDATAKAFRAPSDRDAINALLGLRGVALRTATALLHWMRPDRFPILDFRVVGALQESEPKNWEDLDYYLRIAEKIRSLAGNLNIELRTLDRALWAWHKRQTRS